MHINDLIILYCYNYWARDRILAAADQLDPSHLTDPALMTDGTMLGTLTHILNVEALWRSRCHSARS